MPRARDLVWALPFLAALGTVAAGEPAPDSEPKHLFEAGQLGKSKEPIVVTSDTLEYDYKTHVVVYRGTVQAAQGQVKLRSDTLTVTLKADADADGPAPAAPKEDATAPDHQQLQEIVAVGNVRIDNGTRWATGGRAVFDQSQRTLILTEAPMLHDGSNEVAGDRVIVYLDEDRSVVEGGRKRVKAVLYPGKDGGLAPAGPKKPEASAAAGTPAGPEEPTARVATP
jgi:lipopolysaccharide export system protein LptA